MKLHKHQTGFTVVEMLVAISLTSFIMIATVTFLINTITTNSIDSARSDLLREAQLSLDVITRDIRLSASVDDDNRWVDSNSPNAGSTGGYGWTSADSVLILAKAATDENKDVIFDDPLNYITHKDNEVFFVEDGVLYKRTLAGDNVNNSALTTCPSSSASAACPADTQLAKNVTSFDVNYYDINDDAVDPALARSVEVTLTLSEIKYNTLIRASYSTRSVFRNE
jgi:Tfp pilus assembly protein PilW